MTRPASLRFEIAWVSLAIIGVAILVFGLALWYYPVFWTAHLVGTLPPGKDHIHQVVFIVLSVIGLLLPVGEFFPARTARTATTS